MQKIVWTWLAAGMLAGCYCKCSVEQTPRTAPQAAEQTAQQPAAPELPPAQTGGTVLSQTDGPKGQAAGVQKTQSAVSARPVQSAAATTPATPQAATTPAPASGPQEATGTGFHTEQTTATPNTDWAAALIAAQRTAQPLKNPPADTPVFKKEELLPTDGRLLSPLAYEPILPDTTHAPWSNESLKYGIYYSFVKAGTAYIKTRGLTQHNGKTAYLIQTTAFSASAIDAVFKVRDINYSWLDTQTLCSLGYSQSVREGNYVRDEWVTFEPENNRYYGQVRKKDEPRTLAGELDGEVLDMLTSLYYVRSQPLEIGKDVTFDIINREERYPLVVKVLGKETIKTKAGKFNCWVVEPQFRGEGIFVAKGKSLKVWLTDDEYRMPVKMSVEVFIGSVYAELLDYKRN